ncbi:MAG: tRNA (guanosine(46)-N7)-methyltransferase TrmB [Desulfuromonadaceae bacterium]|nr:tRNA (guanosine(46)-N7)-methyltransferase TrmB [Desulfuromonadaceae bacterium]
MPPANRQDMLQLCNFSKGQFMLIPINSSSFLPWQDGEPPPQWGDIFGNDHPLALEIGCGVGDFVVQMAALHPGWNFIALDFYNKGCLKTCKRIDKGGLSNVRVLRVEARSFIEACILPVSLRAVIINCPDPWPKMRHRKRRLVNTAFVNRLSSFMLPGADFYFATDFDDYGLDVSEFMTRQKGFENALGGDSYRHRLEGYPVSKYMRRFLEEGKQIYYVHYRRSH